jgi:intraflagellar transport protein 140
MKALLRSNDTAKIIYYAERVKKADILIMAANHLSSLDWQHQENVMRTIISFYTKAKAMFELSQFYDACAWQEIDIFRDYAKGQVSFFTIPIITISLFTTLPTGCPGT